MCVCESLVQVLRWFEHKSLKSRENNEMPLLSTHTHIHTFNVATQTSDEKVQNKIFDMSFTYICTV